MRSTSGYSVLAGGSVLQVDVPCGRVPLISGGGDQNQLGICKRDVLQDHRRFLLGRSGQRERKYSLLFVQNDSFFTRDFVERKLSESPLICLPVAANI